MPGSRAGACGASRHEGGAGRGQAPEGPGGARQAEGAVGRHGPGILGGGLQFPGGEDESAVAGDEQAGIESVHALLPFARRACLMLRGIT